MDFGGSHGFKGERRGISRHQQSMKGGGGGGGTMRIDC